jgi:DNA-binding NarL/FixJ family response regulator
MRALQRPDRDRLPAPYLPAPSPFDARHISVIQGLARGLSTGEIAAALSYSTRSVEGIVDSALHRARVSNRQALVAFAIRGGHIEPKDPQHLSGLSRRQFEVAVLISRGDTVRQVATKLGIAERTVSSHAAAARRATASGTTCGLTALVASQDVRRTAAQSEIDQTQVGDRTTHPASSDRWESRPLDEELREWLAPSATSTERIRGLLAMGLSPTHIARATGVSQSTVRSWSGGRAVPRMSSALILDDLRMVAAVLLDGGLGRDQTVAWLTSRDMRTGERPVDALARRPSDVVAAALREIAFDETSESSNSYEDPTLTFGERRLYDLLVKRGLSAKQIAEAFDVSEITARELVRDLQGKLAARRAASR